MKWYLNRLQSMSWAEIGYRLNIQLLKTQERFFPSSSPRRSLRSSISVKEVFSRFQSEADVHFFFAWSDQYHICSSGQAQLSTEREATLKNASLLQAHMITLFGRSLDLGEKIKWHQDPLTGQTWPNIFHADIDTRDGKIIGGVKWVWELNRHHHLVTLAKAYFLTGEESFAQEVCTQLSDWIEANPPLIGVNWTSALELALRLINWTWILAFIRQSSSLTPTLFGSILLSIDAQAHYIARYLSAYSSANNHLIGEAAGLAVVGICFPWLPQAETWRDMGLNILTVEIKKQIYPDGVPTEQATHYLAFILDFNLIVWRLAELNGLTVPAIWYDRLAAACHFIQHLMDEQGYVPAIGDSDDAWVVRLNDHAEVNNFRSILATAAVILDRPDLKTSAHTWDEKSHWLMGEAGQAIFNGLSSVQQKVGSYFFDTGGYCIMRVPKRVVVFDCGPLGYLSTAAHGHADVLSLLISSGGQPLLIDPNTFAYQEGEAWRDYFRGTSAHNTLLVNGANQSEIQGTFLWGRKAKATILHWQSTPKYDWVIAEQDGYTHFDVIHRRAIFFQKPDWIVTVDDLIGQNHQAFQQLWHFAPESKINLKLDWASVVLHGVRQAVIFWERSDLTVQLYQGEEHPIQGWHSPHYSHLEPAPVIELAGSGLLPTQLITSIYLGDCAINTDLLDQKGDLLTSLARHEKDING